MDNEELKRRTKSFAHRCVKLCMSLPNTYMERSRRINGYLYLISQNGARDWVRIFD